MKAIKRHLATVLAAIMIFTTIGNAYVSAKASGDTLDTFGEDAGTHEITVTDQGELATPPAEVTETAPPEEVPPAPVVEDTTPVTPEVELPPTDVQEPVITDQTDVPETGTTDVPETEIVNEDYSVVVVNYDAGVGGKVDYATESFRSDDTSIQLYGSEAIPESGYIFKNWIRTDTNEVVSTDQLLVPDSEEVKWMLGHTADAGGEIHVSYTAQFVAVASEYEKILPNVIKVKILVSEGAFDREVELVVEELQSDTQQYIDAEQALTDAEVEYTGIMAFDIRFEDAETGEEIEPAGPVKMEYEILRRQINKTINETDGLDEITSESQIQMHHMVETENAYTGEKELAVETIADSNIATGEVVQNDDLEDPTAGLDRYGYQETVSMDVTTDARDNVTSLGGEVVVNGFSIFVITLTSPQTTIGDVTAGAHMLEQNEAGNYNVNGVKYQPYAGGEWKDIIFRATGDETLFRPTDVGDLGKGVPADFKIDGVANAEAVFKLGQGKYGQVEQFYIMSGRQPWVAARVSDGNGGVRYETYVNDATGQTTIGDTFYFLAQKEDKDLPTGMIDAHIYLLLDAIYPPQPLHKGYGAGLFGPNKNNSEYFTVKINLDELNKLMTPVIKYPAANKIHYYYTFQSYTISNPTTSPWVNEESTSNDGRNAANQAQAERVTRAARDFFDDVLMNPKVMPNEADREKFAKHFGTTQSGAPNFIGYVLKRENDHYNGSGKSWHIDGIGRDFPMYLLQLYKADNENQDPSNVRAPFATHVNNVPDQYYGSREARDPKTGEKKTVKQVAVSLFEDFFRKEYQKNNEAFSIEWDYSPLDADNNDIPVDQIYHGYITAGEKRIEFNIKAMANRKAANPGKSGVNQGGEITYESIMRDKEGNTQFGLAQFKVWFNELPTGSLKITKEMAGDGAAHGNGQVFKFRLTMEDGTPLFVKSVGKDANNNDIYAPAATGTADKDNVVQLTMPTTGSASIMIRSLTPGDKIRIEEIKDFTVPENHTLTITATPAAAGSSQDNPAATQTIVVKKTVEAVFTNRFDGAKGELLVEKVYGGSGATAARTAGNLDNTINMTLYDANGNVVTFFAQRGWEFVENTHPAAFGDINDGRSGKVARLKDVPAGTYYVVETDAEVNGFDLVKKLNGNEINTTGMAEDSENYKNAFKAGIVTVEPNKTATLTLENIYEPNKGTLKLTKKFTGDATAITKAKDSIRFTIWRRYSDTDKRPLEVNGKKYENIKWAEIGGNANKSESTITITGVEPGQYYVTEDGAGYKHPTDANKNHNNAAAFEAWTVTVTGSGSENGNLKTLTKQGSVDFVLTNDYQRKTIDIKGKKIWGDDKNKDEKRPSTIRVRLAAYVEDANGSITFDGAAYAGKKYRRLTELAGIDANRYTNTYPLQADQTAGYMQQESWDNLFFAADTLNGIPEFTEDGKKILYRLIEMDEADKNREITVDEETGYGVFNNLYKVTYSEDGMTIVNRLDTTLDPFSGGDLGENVPGHKKYIEKSPNAAAWDGTYDLTLTVEGTKGSEEEKAKVDILFISDFSGSMGAYTMGDGTTGKRLDKLKEVLEDLLETVGENDNIDARFAMVGFDGSYTRGDYDYTYQYYRDKYNLDDAYPVVSWREVKSAAARRDFVGEVEKHRKTVAGTNYQAGFREGIEMLIHKPDDRKGTQTYVIFISDGNPTFYYDDRGGTIGTGTETESNIRDSYNGMIAWPGEITTNYFYSILVGPDTKAFGTKDTSDVLKDIRDRVNAKDGKAYYHASNTAELQKTFDEIGKAITTIEVSNVTIKDTLHSNAEFVAGDAALLIEVYNDQGVKIADSSEGGKGRPDQKTSVTFNDGVRNVTMNLVRGERDFTLTFDPADYKLRPGYSYRITAHIEPTQLAYSDYVSRKNQYPDDQMGEAGTHEHAGTTGYYSNDYSKTSLTYTLDGKKTVPYPKPVMRLDTVDYSVEKKFENTPKELMPETVQVAIYEEGKNTALQTLTLGATNQWKGTFEGLRKWKSGKAINYVIKEVGENEGSITLDGVVFTVNYGSVTGNANEGYSQVVTNALIQGKIMLQKTIAYDASESEISDEDKAEIRAELVKNLKFNIYKNGSPYKVISFAEMKGDGDVRTYTESVDPGRYSVEEIRDGAKVASYDLTVDEPGRNAEQRVTNSQGATFNIKNTYKKQTNDELKPAVLRIIKVDDQGNRILTNAAFRLSGYGNPKTLNTNTDGYVDITFDANEFANDTARGVNGALTNAEHAYSLREMTAPAGYELNGQNWNLKVERRFDKMERDGASWKFLYNTVITVEGTEIQPVVENGVPVYEIPVKNRKMRDITVTKVWTDNDNNDGVRPEAAWVRLFANGQKAEDDVNIGLTLTHTWRGLPQYDENGKEIAYTVSELTGQNGEPIASNGKLNDKTGQPTYTVTYGGNMKDGFTVTNTRGDAKVQVRVQKEWDDKNNQDGKRPDSLLVTLKANPVTALAGVQTSVDITKEPNLTKIWTNLPAKVSGVTVQYEVVEMNGATEVGASSADKRLAGKDGAVYTADFQYQATDDTLIYNVKIVNSYTPSLIPVTVTKVWEDKNNQDGVRPDSVWLALYKKVGTVETKVRDAVEVKGNGNTWTTTFKNVPEYEGGKKVEYIVRELNGNTVVAQGGQLPSTKQGKNYTASYNGLTVTNTYNPKPIEITVTKLWDDNRNNDGVRPDSIVVTLTGTAKGKEVYTKTDTISAANAASVGEQEITVDGKKRTVDVWTYTFTGLDENYEGSKIIYTMKENPVVGYLDPVYSADQLTVRNPYSDTTTDVSGFKTWDDSNNQDDVRPAELEITLTGKVGDEVVYGPVSQTITGEEHGAAATTAQKWAYKFTGLPKKDKGRNITYTIEETVTKEMTDAGYETPIYDEPHLNVENPRPVDKTKIVVEKNWDDKDNQDGLRKAVNVRVYKVAQGGDPANINDLTAVSDIEQLGTTQGATVTFDGLDVNEGGKPITYVAYELDANNQPIFAGGKLAVDYGKFYDVSYAEKTPATGVSKHTVVTNKYEPEQIPVEIHKIWDDNSDNDGVRKEVTLQLYKKSGTEFVPVDGTLVTLKAESYNGDTWTHKYTQLFDKYENGRQEIVYEVRELNGGKVVEVDGEIPSKDPERNYTLTKYDGLSVTNKIEKATTERSGKKTWGDNQNQDGARPKSITLTITGTVTINGVDKVVYGPKNEVVNAPAGENTLATWDYSFTNLPKFYQKQEINYTMTEEQVPGYGTPEVTGFDVTNPYNLEDTSVSGKKNWADSNNQDGKRPEKIEVTLTGTIKNGTKQVFGPVTFEVSEKSIYVWDATAKELKLNDAESVILAPGADNRKAQWEYAISKLPKKAEGEVIVYAVKETPLDEALGYGEADQDGFNFTNPRTNDQVKVVVEKNWADNNNQDGKRKGINVRLYKTDLNGAVVEASGVKTLGTEQGATVTFEGLDKNQGQGTPIVYFVRELDDKLNPVENGKTVIDVYTVTYEADKQLTPEEVEAKVAQHMLVTNTYAPVNIDVQAEKEWIDNNDQDGVRPESVWLALYKNGSDTPVQGPVEVFRKDGETNIWKHKFTNVPKFENGVEIVYTVREYNGGTVVAEGGDLPSDGGYAPYKAHYDGLRVTNTYIPETTGFDGVKTWGDNKNQDGKRPTSITITLTGTIPDGNGGTKEVYKTKETFGGDMTAETWSFSFGNTLPKYAEGKEITYRVTEEQITGYEAPQYFYEGDALPEGLTLPEGSDVNVLNPYNPDTTDVSGRKIWGDNRNQDGVRPEKVEVVLTGTIVKNNVTKQVFNEKFDVSVKSVYEWDSAAKKLNLVDAESTVLAPNAADNKLETWEYIVRKLPKKAEGVDITYTVKETPLGIDGYGEPKETGYDVENPYTTKKTSIVVEKNWADEKNQDGLRQNIRVQLYKVVNGAEVAVTGRTATIGMTDGETAWFKDLELNEDGNPVVYVVRELDALGNPILDNGQLSVKNGKEYNVTYDQDANGGNVTEADKKEAANVSKHLKVKNSYVPEEIDIPIEKIWRDTNYTDVRPASVTVELVRSDNKDLPAGVKAKAQITLDADGNWKGEWTDLPKFENEGPANENNAVEIPYDVKELEVKSTNNMDYTVVKTGSRTSGFVITNTIVEQPTEQPVIKIWDDANAYDGIRPKNITVGLFANGELVKSQSISVNDKAVEGKEWSYVFTNLPLRDANGTITYTVGEMVEGGNAQNKADYIIDTGKYNADYDTFVVGNEITNRHAPKIEKEINGKTEHTLTAQSEKFTYTVKTAVPDGKDSKGQTVTKFVITDRIKDVLKFETTAAQVEVKVGAGVVTGANRPAVTIEDKLLTVTFEGASFDNAKGKAVEVKFEASILPNVDLTPYEVENTGEVKIPNTAEYRINDDPGESNEVIVIPFFEKINIPVKKEWQGAEAPAGKTINVGLFNKEQLNEDGTPKDGEEPIETKRLSAPGWSAEFTEKQAERLDGTKIEYAVLEQGENGAWVTTGKGDGAWLISVKGDNNGFTVTNTGNVKGIAEDGTASDKDGAKNDAMEITNRSDTWTYTINTAVPVGEDVKNFIITDTLNDLLVFADGVITVKVDGKEVQIGEQSLEVAAANGQELTVRFGPAEIMNGNTPVDSLPDTLQGKKVEVSFKAKLAPTTTDTDLAPYMVTGGVPNKATIRINNDFDTDSNEVKIKKEPKYVNVPVTKKWAGDKEAERPESITVGVFANDTDGLSQIPFEGRTLPLNAGNSWSAEFVNLPEADANGEITYTVKELSGGQWINAGTYGGKYVVTFDGNDPTNTAVTKTVEANGNGKTNADKTRVDLAANNETFTYTLRSAIPAGEGIKGFVLTDKLESVLEFVGGEANVSVKWAADGKDVTPKPAVAIDDKTLTVTFGKAGDVADTDPDIAEALRGKEFVVSFEAKFTAEALADETLLAPYANKEVPNKSNININNDFNVDSNEVHVVPFVEKIDVEVNKEWKGETANDARREGAVQVALFTRKNGTDTDTGKRATLTAVGNWHHKWEGLIKFDSEDDEIVYVVKEASEKDENGNVTAWTDLGSDVSGNYHVSVSGSMLSQKITNTTITKEVNGSPKSAAVKREEAFTYTLKTVIPESADIKNFIVTDKLEPVLEFVSAEADVQVKPAGGVAKIDPATNTLTVRFGPETVNENTPSLAQRGQAVEISFQVKVPENADITGYTNNAVPNKASFNVNNTFDVESNEVVVIPDVETTEIEVVKEWVNAGKLTKPEYVTVGIFQVGLGIGGADLQFGKNELLNAGNNWTVKFENLPKTTQGGTTIEYVVKELGANGEWQQLGKGNGSFVISAKGTSLKNIGVVKDIEGEDSYNVAAEGAEEVFTYNITTTIPDAEGTKNFTITDTLESVLEFVSTEDKVTVTVGGQPAATDGADKPQVTIAGGRTLTVLFGVAQPASVDPDTGAWLDAAGNEIPDLSDALKGKEVKVTFEAKIREGADISKYENRQVPNKSTVKVNNTFDTDSNIVKVTDEEKTVDIPVEKKFANEKLKTKPGYVTVGVFEKGGNEDGTDKKADQENLSDENGWKHTFRNLPEYNSKEQKITYVVKELATDGQWKDLGVYNNTYVISVKATEKMPYTVKETDQEGKEIEVNKEADGFTVTNTGGTKTVTADGAGTTNADKTHADLAAEDETFTYTIETTIPDAEGIKSFVVEDTLESILEFVDENAISVTPASGKVTFGTGTDSKGREGRKLIVTWGNPDAKDTDLDMTEKGQKVTVTFQAKVKTGAPNLSDYTDKKVPNKTTFRVNNDYTTESNTVTVTPKVDDVTIPVKKNWQGIEAPEGKVVTVGVFSRVTDAETGEVTDTLEGQSQVQAPEWETKFEKLPKYDDNNTEIVYVVKELGAKGAWVETGEGDGAWVVSIKGYDVTNTGSVKSIVEDGSDTDQDGKTEADGTYEIENRRAVWTYKIETAVPVGEDVKNFIITDTLNDLLVFADDPELTVKVDGKDVAVGAQSLEVAQAGTTEAPKTLTVRFGPEKISEEQNGKTVYVVNSLPDTLQGKTVEITFKAKLAPTTTDKDLEPYMTTGGVPNKATIRLNNDFNADSNEVKIKKEPTLINIPVQKNWKGDSEADRPKTVTVGVFANDTDGKSQTPVTGYTAILTAPAWNPEFKGLPETDENGEITYTVKELAASGEWIRLGKLNNRYVVTFDGDNPTNTAGTKTVNKTKLTNADEEFTYTINTAIPSGEDVKSFTVTDTLEHVLRFVVKDVDATDDQTKYGISVKGPEGAVVDVDEESRTLTVSWGPKDEYMKDAEGNDILDEEGKPVPVALGVSGEVTISFDARVREDASATDLLNYISSVDKGIPNEAEIDINNKHKVKTNKVVVEPKVNFVEIEVTKKWVDENNKAGQRPQMIKIGLFSRLEGEDEGTETLIDKTTQTLTAPGWAYTYGEEGSLEGKLPVKQGSKRIVYIVKEQNAAGEWIEVTADANGKLTGTYNDVYTVTVDVTEGPTADADDNETMKVTVTNKAATNEIIVRKVWEDDNNSEKLRPGTVTIGLFRQIGEDPEETEPYRQNTLTGARNWNEKEVKFENLPLTENGKKITYTVKELTEDGESWITFGMFNDDYVLKSDTVTEGEAEAAREVRVLTNKLPEDPVLEKEVKANDKAEITKETVKFELGKKTYEKELSTHAKLAERDDEVTYEVLSSIPDRPLKSFTITDKVVEELEIIEGSATVTVQQSSLNVPQPVIDKKENTITVTFEDAQFLEDNAGKPVKLTFQARIKDGADISKYLVAGKRGVPNKAEYEYVMPMGDPVKRESNEVTVEPPDPKDPVKEVQASPELTNEAKTIAELKMRDETFTYTISADLPESLVEKVVITDTIKPVLTFVGAPKVTFADGTAAAAAVDMKDNVLTVTFAKEFVHSNAGKKVFVTFQAKIRDDATAQELSQYIHPDKNGIENKATYEIDNRYKVDTNPVYVTPADPRIEKQVTNAALASHNDKKSHADLDARYETYPYTIFTEMPLRNDVVSFTVTDTLEEVLHFESTKEQVGVTVGGANAKRSANVTIDEATRTLTVEFKGDYVEQHMGEEVVITFNARINAGADLSGYEQEVNLYKGQYPKVPELAPRTTLERIPNMAKYTIVTKREARLAIRRDWIVQKDSKAQGSEITRESNVVTVTPPEEINIKVKKVWDDEDNRQGRRPAEVKVTLLENGQPKDYEYIDEQGQKKTVEATVTLNEENNWTAESWVHLPKYAKGTKTEITYQVEEEAPEAYQPRYKKTATADGYEIEITNKYDPEKTHVTVIKRWVDQNNRFGTRPASITAVLQADGKEVARAELNQANDFMHTWEDLDKFLEGKEVKYTVVEAPVPEGYTVNITNSRATTFVITNTMQTGTLIVNKVATGLPGGTNPNYTFVIRNATTGEQVANLRISGSGSGSVEVAPGSYIVEELGANESTVRNYTMVTTGSGQTVVVRQGVSTRADIVNRYTPDNPPPTREVPPDTPINQNPPVEAPEVLGVRRTDSESVLGARRGKTGDKSGARNMIAMFAAGAAAMLLALTGRRKKKDGDEG